MDGVVKYISLLVVGVALFLSSWYVMHGDLYFYTDVARDFHLYREIDEKKIVLLGPKSSTSGLFHGPLWLYVNYPAYVIGGGNPLVVGWYWILLIGVFLATSWVLVKKIFGSPAAYIYVALISVQLVFAANSLFNPYGTLFLIPAFYYFFIRYIQKQNMRHLLVHLFIAGCIIQFGLATGIPLLLLSTCGLVFTILKKRTYTHFLAFFILFIPLSTFILFDVRHQFLQFHAALEYIGTKKSPTDSQSTISYIFSRLKLIVTPGFQLFYVDLSGLRNILGFIIVGVILFLSRKQKKFRPEILWLLYFILGSYVLMLINRSGDILFHYYMPLSAFTLLLFSSLVRTTFQKLFLVIFFIVLTLNIRDAVTYIQSSNSFIGKSQFSWRSLDEVAKALYSTKDSSFGYFVYSPDVVGHQPKYAVLYEGMKSKKTTYSFEKKPITYLVVAPPPPDKPSMTHEWWKKNQLHLDKKPTDVKTFPSGYLIERYELSEEELRVPFDPGINPGLHFR